MAHIPTVAETFRWLGDTVADCQAKLPDHATTFTLQPGGIAITVSRAGVSNAAFVAWDDLVAAPALLPRTAGQCAGELMTMRAAREKVRQGRAVGAAPDTEETE